MMNAFVYANQANKFGQNKCDKMNAYVYALMLMMTMAIGVASSITPTKTQPRPNILLLITDDQDLTLGGASHMPNLKRLMTDQGTTFRNYFVHTPICCPSRATILSGRYLQNHAVFNNTFEGNCGGLDWQDNVENYTIGVYAKQVGYQTGYAGKYLNTYAYGGLKRVPPGWDKWLAIVGNSQYYTYNVVQSDDGGISSTRREHGKDYAKDYFSDVVANRTLDMIRTFTDPTSPSKPFLIVTSWPAPHDPIIPAPWASGRFKNVTAPRSPNWNASKAYMSQKHWLLRKQSPIDRSHVRVINSAYRRRLQTLLSVDQHIEQFTKLLKERWVLQNTIIIYTSDNGFTLGQHRILNEKSQLYESNIRVPFIVRGPNIPKNISNFDIVVNIDIAPTIYQLVQTTTHNQSVPIPDTMDGISFLPISHNLIKKNTIQKRHDFLVSYHGEGVKPCGLNICPTPPPDNFHRNDCSNNTYHCVRSIILKSGVDFTYCQFEDDEKFIEYYDNSEDPWQLHNMYPQLPAVEKSRLIARLAVLKACRGNQCRRTLGQSSNAVLVQPQVLTSDGYQSVSHKVWLIFFSLLMLAFVSRVATA